MMSLSHHGRHPSQGKAVLGIIIAASLNLGDSLPEDPFHFMPVEPDESCVSCTLPSGKIPSPPGPGVPARLKIYLLEPFLDVPSIMSAFPHFQVVKPRIHTSDPPSQGIPQCPYCLRHALKGFCFDCFFLLHSSTEVLPPLQPSQCDLLDVAQIHVCSFENGTSLCNDCFHGQGISCVQWPCQADSQCGVEQIFPALFKPRL